MTIHNNFLSEDDEYEYMYREHRQRIIHDRLLREEYHKTLNQIADKLKIREEKKHVKKPLIFNLHTREITRDNVSMLVIEDKLLEEDNS
jgi:hypothetical protein